MAQVYVTGTSQGMLQEGCDSVMFPPHPVVPPPPPCSSSAALHSKDGDAMLPKTVGPPSSVPIGLPMDSLWIVLNAVNDENGESNLKTVQTMPLEITSVMTNSYRVSAALLQASYSIQLVGQYM